MGLMVAEMGVFDGRQFDYALSRFPPRTTEGLGRTLDTPGRDTAGAGTAKMDIWLTTNLALEHGRFRTKIPYTAYGRYS